MSERIELLAKGIEDTEGLYDLHESGGRTLGPIDGDRRFLANPPSDVEWACAYKLLWNKNRSTIAELGRQLEDLGYEIQDLVEG